MVQKTIISLDVSTTRTGYAVYGEDKLVESGYISPKGKLDWVGRVRYMIEVIKELDNYHTFTHVVVEDTYVSKNINTVKKLCFAQGMIVGSLPNTELIQIYPTQWKSHFNLTKKKTKRTEQKDTSMTIAEAMLLHSISNDDEADAILMGKYVIDKQEELLNADK